jgi:hypothetical protein
VDQDNLVALCHAPGQVVVQERSFLEQYLHHLLVQQYPSLLVLVAEVVQQEQQMPQVVLQVAMEAKAVLECYLERVPLTVLVQRQLVQSHGAQHLFQCLLLLVAPVVLQEQLALTQQIVFLVQPVAEVAVE